MPDRQATLVTSRKTSTYAHCAASSSSASTGDQRPSISSTGNESWNRNGSTAASLRSAPGKRSSGTRYPERTLEKPSQASNSEAALSTRSASVPMIAWTRKYKSQPPSSAGQSISQENQSWASSDRA